MENNNGTVSRSKFMIWVLGLLASFTALRYLKSFADNKSANQLSSNKTVKLLGEDGQLVEVDPALLGRPLKKISTEHEIRTWIKK
jgi:hypothetical protein